MKQLINNIQTWWRSISLREQRLMVLCLSLVVLGGLYWGVVQPVTQRAENAELRLQSEKQLLSWVKNKADKISQYQRGGSAATSNLPINQAVSASVGRFNIELIRMQPRGEQFQVWVAPLPFNQFINWLALLQQNYGVEVIFVDIDKGDKQGMIEVNRLQLGRG